GRWAYAAVRASWGSAPPARRRVRGRGAGIPRFPAGAVLAPVDADRGGPTHVRLGCAARVLGRPAVPVRRLRGGRAAAVEPTRSRRISLPHRSPGGGALPGDLGTAGRIGARRRGRLLVDRDQGGPPLLAGVLRGLGVLAAPRPAPGHLLRRRRGLHPQLPLPPQRL